MKLKHGDRIQRGRALATVVDVYGDHRGHLNVIPDDATTACVVWEVDGVERISGPIRLCVRCHRRGHSVIGCTRPAVHAPELAAVAG